MIYAFAHNLQYEVLLLSLKCPTPWLHLLYNYFRKSLCWAVEGWNCTNYYNLALLEIITYTKDKHYRLSNQRLIFNDCYVKVES